MTAPEQMRAEWQPISTVDRVNGLRLILAWDDCPNLSYHWEVGRWSRELGWVNTYGKPFGGGEPTHWMIPEAPSASTRPATDELVEIVARCAFEALGFRPPLGDPFTWEYVIEERWDIVPRLREIARTALRNTGAVS